MSTKTHALAVRGWKAAWSLVIGALVAAGAGGGLAARADQLPALPAAVVAEAKRSIVPFLEQEGIGSVGVLKFIALDGSGADVTPSQRLGAINADLASQFQLAILMNVSRKDPIAVLRDPSGVAAGIPGATHLTAEGRAKLFAAEYPVVVGMPEQRVKPGAFIFGIVQIADDLQTAQTVVTIASQGRDGKIAVRKLCNFPASLRADDLSAFGKSFAASRGAFTGGKPASLAADVQAGRKPFPLQDPTAPITLSIAYDGAVQRIEFRDGGAFVAEPRQGQKVTITIAKTKADGQRYAAALKVNGENMAQRDTRPDLTAMKWVLSDDSPTRPVRGYSVSTDAIQPFTVLSDADSARRAFDYGVDAGTITMTVYAERTANPDGGDADVKQQIAAATAAGVLDRLLTEGGVRLDPNRTFASLDEAKGTLETTLASADRGVIVADSGSQSFKQEVVPFNKDPDPVMSAVIRYYTPR